MRALSGRTRHVLMTADAVGGVWTYALDLAEALAPLGTRVTLAVLGPLAPARRAEAETRGVALVETGWPLDWLAEDAAAVRQAGQGLAALAARLEVDLVHLNSPALAAAARFPCPVLGVCHSCLATWWEAVRGGPPPADFAWRIVLLAEGYAACDALVAPSRAFAEATRRAYRLDHAPEVVPNGRAPGPVAEAMADCAFAAGRLWDGGKDMATLDRAAARLDMPVLAAGPVRGPNGTDVALPHLRLLGTLDAAAVQRHLAQGPVFVSTARYEPFGLAVLEAAQAGCALVLSDIPTFRELWDGAAVFVAPGDAEGFAEALTTLSRNREQRSVLCVAARERAGSLTAQRMARGVAVIHARLAEASGANGRDGAGSVAA